MQTDNNEFCERLDQIYDAYRTASMNHKYYGYRLAAYSKFNWIYEVAVAIGSSTSAVAAWPVWSTQGGKQIWTVFTGLVGLCVVLKPFLRLSQKVEQYSQLYLGYKDLYQDLKKIVYGLRLKKMLSKENEKLFNNTQSRIVQLDRIGEVSPSERIRQRSFDEVNVEIPLQSLWYPDDCLPQDAVGIGQKQS